MIDFNDDNSEKFKAKNTHGHIHTHNPINVNIYKISLTFSVFIIVSCESEIERNMSSHILVTSFCTRHIHYVIH